MKLKHYHLFPLRHREARSSTEKLMWAQLHSQPLIDTNVTRSCQLWWFLHRPPIFLIFFWTSNSKTSWCCYQLSWIETFTLHTSKTVLWILCIFSGGEKKKKKNPVLSYHLHLILKWSYFSLSTAEIALITESLCYKHINLWEMTTTSLIRTFNVR